MSGPCSTGVVGSAAKLSACRADPVRARLRAPTFWPSNDARGPIHFSLLVLGAWLFVAPTKASTSPVTRCDCG